MRILFVVDEPLVPTNSGGRVETRSEVELLTRDGHDVVMVMCARRSESRTTIAENEAAFADVRLIVQRSAIAATLVHPTYPLFCARRMPPRQVLERLRSELKAGGPFDLVIAAHEYTLPLAAALSARVGGRLLLRSHNDEVSYFRGLAKSAGPIRRLQYSLDAARLSKRLDQLLAPVDTVAAISCDDARVYAAAFSGEVITVPPVLARETVDPTAVPGFGVRSNKLIFVGSLDVAYALEGIKWFLQGAWPLIRHNCPSASVEFVGRGMGREFEALVAGVAGVVATGELAEIEPVLDAGKVFINPVFEGSGINMKIGPPLARGLPVVTTPFGVRGLATLTDAVAIAATPEAFADSCCSLLNDPQRWSSSSMRGIASLCESFTSDAVAASWRAAMSAAVAEGGGG